MNEELVKSLTDLIDETIAEIEEIKKSDRFHAAEIELKGPGEGHLAGKPTNGKLGKEEKKDDEEDEDDDDAKKNDSKTGMPEGTCEKGANEEADPDAGHHKMDKGANEEADPDAGHHKMDKADDEEDEDEEDDEEDEGQRKFGEKGSKKHADGEKKDIKNLARREGMKVVEKSKKEAETLLKSMLDERVRPLEDKLDTIFNLVRELADAPVAPRGATARMVPLAKSAEEYEPMTKSQVANRLFELKKSGEKVDSSDITRVELGGQADVNEIARKYNLK